MYGKVLGVHILFFTAGLKRFLFQQLGQLNYSSNYVLRNKARSSGTIQSIILEPEEITKAKRLWTVQAQTLPAQEICFNEWKKQFGLFLDHKGI